MRGWMAIASCALLMSCGSDAQAPAKSVPVGERTDGGMRSNPGFVPGAGSSSSDDDDDDDARDGGTGGEGALLRDLTETQLEALCDEVAESFGSELSTTELDQVSCAFSALFSVEYVQSGEVLVINRAQCQEHVADCVTLSAGTRRLICESDAFRRAASSCDGAAQDFRACAEVSAEAYGDAVNVLTCDNLADARRAREAFRASVDLDPFSHDDCVALVTRCPNLFGDATRGEPAEDGCDDTCSEADDGWCDDGGLDSQTSICPLGTDCLDCGRR